MASDSIVTIGGMGGSGTRLVASALRRAGFFLGEDLNDASDNLWFTLLFKQPDLPTWSEAEIDRRLALLMARMDGSLDIDDGLRAELASMTAARAHHPTSFLEARVETFLSGIGIADGRRWGWKEPNTHLVAHRLLETRDDVVYIHVSRHGIDMALSANQNQAENWSHWLLGEAWSGQPSGSLRYWRAVTTRALALADAWTDRVLLIDFDQWCDDPVTAATQLAAFVGMAPSSQWLAGEARAARRDDRPRWLSADLSTFAPDDLAFVQACGYPVSSAELAP